MSYTVRFAPQARDQLDAIEEFIALASGFPATAARFVDGIVVNCESFATFPERGTRRDDLLPGLRIIGYRKNVTIAYRVDSAVQVVSVIGVYYGGQNYEGTMSSGQTNDAEH